MTEQSKDYQRGYAAGLRREDREERERQRSHAIALARYQLAAAIVPKVMDAPWVRSDGTKLNNAAGIAGTVADLVNAIENKLF